MPVYDYICPQCGNEESDVVAGMNEIYFCKECNSVSERQTGTPSFKVKGHNAKNGYSRKKTALDCPPR